MFDAFEEELLDLTATERGHAGQGLALAGFPLCCSIVLCITLSSSSSSRDELV